MSMSNATETDVMAYIFNATAFPSYGATLYVALHSSDPGESGTQNSNEVGYSNYARVGVARTSGGWTVTSVGGATQAVNAGSITFPTCGVTGATATYFSVGLLSSGAGQILYSGALSGSVTIANGQFPYFAASAITLSLD